MKDYISGPQGAKYNQAAVIGAVPANADSMLSATYTRINEAINLLEDMLHEHLDKQAELAAIIEREKQVLAAMINSRQELEPVLDKGMSSKG